MSNVITCPGSNPTSLTTRPATSSANARFTAGSTATSIQRGSSTGWLMAGALVWGAAGGSLLPFAALGVSSAEGGAPRCVGGDFVPAADLLSLLVQRKKAKKHLNECGALFPPWSSIAAL